MSRASCSRRATVPASVAPACRLYRKLSDVSVMMRLTERLSHGACWQETPCKSGPTRHAAIPAGRQGSEVYYLNSSNAARRHSGFPAFEVMLMSIVRTSCRSTARASAIAPVCSDSVICYRPLERRRVKRRGYAMQSLDGCHRSSLAASMCATTAAAGWHSTAWM